MTLHDQLVNHPIFGAKVGYFKLVPLHSSLSSEEQSLVFAKMKEGKKSLISTSYIHLNARKILNSSNNN